MLNPDSEPQRALAQFVSLKALRPAMEAGCGAFMDYSPRNTVDDYDHIYVAAAVDYLTVHAQPGFSSISIRALTCILAFPALDLGDTNHLPPRVCKSAGPLMGQIDSIIFQRPLFNGLLDKVVVDEPVRDVVFFLGMCAFHGRDLSQVDIPNLHSKILHSATMDAPMSQADHDASLSRIYGGVAVGRARHRALWEGIQARISAQQLPKPGIG